MKTAFSLLVFVLMTSLGFSARAATKEEMVNFVTAAKEHIAKAGKDQAFKDFSDTNNKEWQKGELYLFAYDYDGKYIQHGKKPDLVGKVATGLQDKKGKFFVKEMLEILKKDKKGFLEYYFPNPANMNQIENKLVYILDVDGKFFIGSGIYPGK